MNSLSELTESTSNHWNGLIHLRIIAWVLFILFTNISYALLPTKITSPHADFNGRFGHAVDRISDVDGDGYDDLLVAALLEDNNQNTAKGVVYLLNGRSGTPIRQFESPNPELSGFFGQSISSVLDLNNDSFDDILVGAPGENNDEGRVYVFSGIDGKLIHQLSVNYTFPENDGEFGFTVKGISDVDSDGAGDILVGAKSKDQQSNQDAGEAYLLSGLSGDILHTFTPSNPITFGGFGEHISKIPDVDGDGHEDIVIGTEIFSSVSYLQVCQLPGSTSPNLGLPDADGDGLGDVVVEHNGELGIYKGNSAELIRSLTSSAPSGYFSNLHSMALVNNFDGYNQKVIIISSYSGIESDGRLWVFSAETGEFLKFIALPFPLVESEFGSSMASLIDVDNDGRSDLIIGDPGYFSKGAVFLFSGSDGRILNDTNVISGIGDVNDNSYGDVLAGTSIYDGFSYRHIRTFASPHESDPNYSGGFGTSISSVPDVDGDGADEVIIGAAGESIFEGIPLTEYPNIGRAYLYSGKQGTLINEFNTPIIDTYKLNNRFGLSTSGIDDINGDGKGDVIIGAHGEFSVTGRVYVFSGGAGSLIHGIDPPDLDTRSFGWIVSSIWDINEDGTHDILIGAPASGHERAYSFSGLTGELLHTYQSPHNNFGDGGFGQFISPIPDVDGDNVADVVVSSDEQYLGEYPPDRFGTVFIFSGSSGDLIREIKRNNITGKYFGSSVHGMPDVDEDGYGDLLIGIKSTSQAGNTSAVHLFSGATGDLLLDIPFREQGNAGFEAVVSSSFDCDNDGIHDILVADDSIVGDEGVHVYHSRKWINSIIEPTTTPTPTPTPTPTISPTPTPTPPPEAYYFALWDNTNGVGAVRVNGVERTPLWSTYFDNGTTITLQAVPADGWQFREWKRSISSQENPLIFEIQGYTVISADFIEAEPDNGASEWNLYR